jgi:hypothetical protein
VTAPSGLPSTARADAEPASAADPDSDEALRERLRARLAPDLVAHLTTSAIAALDRTLIDIERDVKSELAAWREEQAARIRSDAQAEVERALDALVTELRRGLGRD